MSLGRAQNSVPCIVTVTYGIFSTAIAISFLFIAKQFRSWPQLNNQTIRSYHEGFWGFRVWVPYKNFIQLLEQYCHSLFTAKLHTKQRNLPCTLPQGCKIIWITFNEPVLSHTQHYLKSRVCFSVSRFTLELCSLWAGHVSILRISQRRGILFLCFTAYAINPSSSSSFFE